MKKIIALSLVAGAFAATSAFGQGFLVLQSGKTAATDDFTTPGTAINDTKVDVALFISSSSTATPLVESLFNGTATAGGTITSSVGQTAWTDITTDPNFAEAIDATATPGNFVVMQTSTKGVAQYNSGSGFGLQNGTSVGENVSFYEVSWNGSLFSTLAAAAAADGAVGWSPVLNSQTMTSQSSVTPESPLFTSFGTLGVVASVPEPGTMALAALGGLSLLAFRRKK